MPDLFVSKTPLSGASQKPDYKNSASMLSSFCENPANISFQHQHPNEDIVLFLRSHFITNLPWIITGIFLVLLPLAIPFIMPFLNLDFFSASKNLTIIALLFYYLVVFSFTLINFMTWFYNIFIVTKERVIDIDYSNVVIHNVAETKMSHIQDVNYTQTGFIHSLFNYGDVFVQTAGNEVNFEALSVPNPREAVKIIASLIGKQK